jgi:hypothetical protein
MRFAFIVLVMAGCMAGCASNPATYGPPRDFTPAGDRNFAVASNVVTLDPEGGTFEASIAVDPSNPMRLVTSATKHGAGRKGFVEAHYSHDGGVTWTNAGAMSMTPTNGRVFDGSGDPVMVADRAGRFYSVYIVSKGLGPYDVTGLACSRSDDGGKTWSQPVMITEIDWPEGVFTYAFDDKEWLTVDNSGGPHDGTLYVHWQRMEKMQVGARSGWLLSKSTDQGRTWSEPRETVPPEVGGAALLEVGPDSELYLGHNSGARGGYVFQKSTDAGATFTEPVLMARHTAGATQTPPRRYFAYPRLHVDRSWGTHRGNIYFVSATSGTTPAGRRVPVASVVRSTDGGRTWSQPRAVTAPGEGDALFPMGAVDERTGELVVVWYDRRDDPSALTARIYATRSRDGGQTFEPARAFSPSFSVNAEWLSEYYAVTAAGQHFVATFSDAAGHLATAIIDFDPPSGPRRRGVRR